MKFTLGTKSIFLTVLIMFTGLPAVHSQSPEILHLCSPSAEKSVFLRSDSVHGGTCHWEARKFSEVSGDGSVVSDRNFKAVNWCSAVVPGTVLTTLVSNHVFPDPYFGDNNRKTRGLIPDLSDAGKEYYHYWYRTSFTIPAGFKGRRIWLKFNGINYHCKIWLNGRKLGEMAGMFNTKTFEITRFADFSHGNILAVNVQPVDFPGTSLRVPRKRPGAKGENHNGGNGEIGKNVTMLMTVGWDFTFPDGVRDRNTGIWRDVELFATGDVVLSDPQIKTDLQLPDTGSARLTISAGLHNYAAGERKGKIVASVDELHVSLTEDIVLKAGETKMVTFSSDRFPQLEVQNPQLWWPINKGGQKLYHLRLSIIPNSAGVSHQLDIPFGIREISSDQATPDSSRRFLVNGCPVFIRGSNWIPEAMCRDSEKRTRASLMYTRQAGINLLRLWGGGIAESDLFYEMCDELGILVWQEFWLTGDTRFPADTALYFANVESTVKRIRNHPSLAYYVASNESDQVPGTGRLIRELDGTRGFQAESECCGVHDGSPYVYVNPMQYFENTASKRGSRIDGFNPEYGTPCLPVVESLKKMMPADVLWPIVDSVWNYLDGGGFHKMTTLYRDAVEQFGKSSSIDDYAEKAQCVGAMDYRSVWEAWNYNKFKYGDRFASGLLYWYHDSPEPQVCGRLYDWYLQPTAALYFTQNALAPLHPQFDYLKNTVSVYNDYRKAFHSYNIEAAVFTADGNKVLDKKAFLNIPADGVVNDALKLDFPGDISQVHFIRLWLRDESGKVVADAFYWRSRDKYSGAWTMTGPAVSGFQEMADLPRVQPGVRINHKIENERIIVNVGVDNPSGSIVFFNRLSLKDRHGAIIAPIFLFR